MKTRYEHITLNEDRVPGIVGTTMKVVEQQAHGWSPDFTVDPANGSGRAAAER